MNLDQMNKWLTLVANLGVVVGIVFVGYQIRLNTDAMRSSTQAQMVTNWNTITQDVATHPGLIRAMHLANEHGVSLWEKDRVTADRLGYLSSSLYTSTEYEFMEAQRGNVDDELWTAHSQANREYIASQPFMLINWTGIRSSSTAGFREFVDNMIIGICSHQTCPVGGRPQDWQTTPSAAAAPEP